MINPNFLARVAAALSVSLLLLAASCAQQASDMSTSSPATEIVFPEGATIDLDLPIETSALLTEVEQMGGSYWIYGDFGPKIEGIDADRVYKISTKYDSAEAVQRQYFAYEVDGQIVHVEAQFARPAQP